MRKVSRVICISVICYSLIGQLAAQSSITSTEFIQQYLVVVNNNKVASLTDDFETSWLEELEFRTETRVFDFDQQQYTLRFKPTTKKLRNAQTNLSNLLEEEFLLKKADFGKELIVDAYEDWLELVMLQKKITIHNDLSLMHI